MADLQGEVKTVVCFFVRASNWAVCEHDSSASRASGDPQDHLNSLLVACLLDCVGSTKAVQHGWDWDVFDLRCSLFSSMASSWSSSLLRSEWLDYLDRIFILYSLLVVWIYRQDRCSTRWLLPVCVHHNLPSWDHHPYPVHLRLRASCESASQLLDPGRLYDNLLFEGLLAQKGLRLSSF